MITNNLLYTAATPQVEKMYIQLGLCHFGHQDLATGSNILCPEQNVTKNQTGKAVCESIPLCQYV